MPATRRFSIARAPDASRIAQVEGAELHHMRAVLRLAAGARVAILDAGAYGSVMSSAYNARPVAAEVMVNGSEWSVIRERDSHADLWRAERMPHWLE